MTIEQFLQENPLIEYTPAPDEFVFWKGELVEDEDLQKLYAIIRNADRDVIHYFTFDNPALFAEMADTILQKYNNLV